MHYWILPGIQLISINTLWLNHWLFLVFFLPQDSSLPFDVTLRTRTLLDGLRLKEYLSSSTAMVILVMADITNKLQINFLAPRSVNWALWKETLREIEYGSRIFIREQPHGRQRKKWDSDECLTSLRHHQSCSAVGQNGWTFVSSPWLTTECVLPWEGHGFGQYDS